MLASGNYAIGRGASLSQWGLGRHQKLRDSRLGHSVRFETRRMGRAGPGCRCSRSVELQSTIDRIHDTGIIPSLMANSSDLALDAARAVLDSGLDVVEVTMTTPSAATIIHSLVREYPTALIGAGRVVSLDYADMAKQAGAKFLTSPVTVEEVVVAHKDGPVPIFPGAMTPTEILTAYHMGACAVKLFPVSFLGHLNFVQAIRKTLAHVPVILSNGISMDMVEPYLNAGAMAVVMSEAIFEEAALESRDFYRIASLARAAKAKCDRQVYW